MLRFSSERRAWVFAAFVVLVLVIGLWAWGMPRATTRASLLIGNRFGVDAAIAETRFSFGGVELREVELRGRHGGLLVRLDRVRARIGWVRALFSGSGAVRAVSAEGVQVVVDLAHDGIDQSLAELELTSPQKPSNSGASGTSGGGRTYAIEGLSIRVDDAAGPLVSMKEVSFRKEGDELRSSVRETLLGTLNADHAIVGPSKVVLRRSEGVWRMGELEIDGASIRSLRNGEDARTALASRIRVAVSRLRNRNSGVRPEPDPQEDLAQPTPAMPRPPAPEQLFERLSPDARVGVSKIQIESRTSEGHVERIRDFELGLRGEADGWFRITAGGQTSNKGTLDVDLRVMPTEARADGMVRIRGISLALIAPFAPDLPLYNTEVGTVSAEIELAASSPQQVRIEGRLELRELALASERIASEPVEHVNLDVSGKGVWHPDERRLQIERGRVRMGEAQMLFDGELERTQDHYRVDLTAKLPPTRCNDVVGAIPADVLDSLSHFEWSGTWSGIAHVSLDSRTLEETDLSIRVRNLCEFERAPSWVRVERFQGPFRHRAIEPDETVFEMRTGPGTEYWVAFADISPFVVPAVISHEDGAFYEHGGFAPWAIRDALVRNLQEGRYVVGASTISMQLAKNLYLQREKTLARKVQEVILTWWLENALSKDQILELYLNVIEYGPSVYGLRHAAAYYFGREPSELSPAESAFLACMLPSPKRYHVSYERGALTRSMKSRMRRLLEHMAKRERIGPEALAYGLAEIEDFHFRAGGEPLPPPRALPPLGAPENPDPEALDPFENLFVDP
jgi:hypothetical protein